MPVPTPTLSPAAARRLLRPLFRIALHPRLPFVAQRRILELLAPVQRCPAG
ncbi:MAG: esterase, partial [Rhodococcus sp.]|nr:esterase [Rhodococcus sp. (in: high G+C Gram-positive bacteria)]